MKTNKIIVLLLLYTSTACGNWQVPEPPEIDIPKNELNTKIAVSAPEGWNDFTIGEPITLSIINISGENIIFDPDYGARTFVYEEDEWRETSNRLIGLNSEEIVLEPTRINPNSTGTTSILPAFNTNASRYHLRIYVVGHIYDASNFYGEKTGAFIDIVLK